MWNLCELFVKPESQGHSNLIGSKLQTEARFHL